MAPNTSKVIGVLFRREDCAGIFRRLLATFVDGGLLVVFVVGWWAACRFTLMGIGGAVVGWLWFASVSLAAILYFAVLKRSDVGTLGYRLAGIRVVGLDGSPPGFWAMFLRFGVGSLWLFTGSLLLVLDLLWLGGDDQRQSLRDKLAGTLVVRRNAIPIAAGCQTVSLNFFIGWSLLFREVRPSSLPPPDRANVEALPIESPAIQ